MAAPMQPAGERSVYFADVRGRLATHIYHGAELSPGAELRGPAIIEESTTSVVIAPGDICMIDPLGNYVIHRPANGGL
jgi:N-methylhydantoinase A